MRTNVKVGLFVLICLVSGLAHGDTIGLYADPSGESCNIVATTPFALTYVYVVHVTDGAAASMFRAPKPACWTGATWIGDSTPYCAGVGCGDSQTGIALVYGACRIDVHILTITYFVQGASESCCLYPLLPHPWSPGGQVEVADCQFNPGVAMGLIAAVNGGPTCPCGYPVPVEETTWGRVKSLYGD
jgi:hypothetical protein